MQLQKQLRSWEETLSSYIRIKELISCVEVTDSTMSDAKSALNTFNKTRLNVGNNNILGIALALNQKAGKGRNGRDWHSTKNAFLATYTITLDRSLNLCSGYSLVVGIAVYEMLLKYGFSGSLKWPNDILNDAKEKIGGILIELYTHNETTIALVGIGLNISQSSTKVPSSGHLKALNLNQLVCATDLSILLNVYSNTFSSHGFGFFRDLWIKYSKINYGSIVIQQNGENINGTFTGVSEQGELLVMINDTLTRLTSVENYL
jgi:BirA family transcriptional regulator, biotin operon repressor / biotin---[acetyl-CoA-carboxylase] ligase